MSAVPATGAALLVTAGWLSCTPVAPSDRAVTREARAAPRGSQAALRMATSAERTTATTSSAGARLTAASSRASATAAAVPQPSPCPADMVAVAGDYCPRLELRCLERRKPWQCAKYQHPGQCQGDVRPLRYCIDRYEHPNRAGALAEVMKSWRDARASCESRGKRLCNEAEWTLACEGPRRLAFPYGNVRDASACAIDKPSPRVNEAMLFWHVTQAAELARLDQREPSGSRPRCVSDFGVHDLTGNVDEWVVSESGRPYRSALKGGNWGEYRNACRPATRGHDEGFRYYQTGFRCCRDVAAETTAVE